MQMMGRHAQQGFGWVTCELPTTTQSHTMANAEAVDHPSVHRRGGIGMSKRDVQSELLTQYCEHMLGFLWIEGFPSA